MTRLLGIDLGERRIGLAIAEGDGASARPHSTLRRATDPDRDAAALAAVIATDRIDELVVGLPLEASGAEGRLGPMKRGRSGGPPSKTQRDAYRARVDREAAAIILQDELDARAVVDALRQAPIGAADRG